MIVLFLLGLVTAEIIVYCIINASWPPEQEFSNRFGPEAGRHLSMMRLTSSDLLLIESGQLEHDDPLLLRFIQQRVLYPPSTPYKLDEPSREDYSQGGQSSLIDKVLSNMHHGFFVEVGVGSGENKSNSLFFERSRNWTGLLVEPNPQEFRNLLRKGRKAYHLDMCMSPDNTTSSRKLRTLNGSMSGLRGYVDNLHAGYDITKNPAYQGDMSVQCVPLAAVMDALGLRSIDYLSLDVEGAEEDMLRSILANDIDINVIGVDYSVYGTSWDQQKRTLEKLKALRAIVEEKGMHQEMAIVVNQPEFWSITNRAFKERYGSYVIFAKKTLI